MKTTRVLATLLCIMMVATCIPMMSLAAPTAAEMDAAGAFLGAASITPTANALANAGGVLDFADSGKNLSITASEMTNAEYVAEGLKLTDGSWRYSGAARWTVFNFGTHVYMKVKAAESGTLTGTVYLCAATHAKAVFKLSKDSITFTDADGTMTNLVDFVPGSDWIEIILQRDPSVSESYSNGAQNWYVKGGNLTSWTKIATTGIDKWLNASYTDGVNFAGSGTVDYCAVVETSDVKQDTSGGGSGEGGGGSEDEDVPTDIPYDAVGEVLGFDTSIAHPGTTDWSGMDLEFTGSFDASAVSGLNVPSGVTFDSKKGAIFPSGDLVVMNYFVAGYQNKWTPMAHGNFGLRFKLNAGGSINLQAAQLWGSVGRVFVDITETGTTVYDGGASGTGQGVAEKLVDYKVGSEWTDILFTTNDAGGYDTYMKKASEDAYTKVASTTSYRSGGNMNGGGTQIAAQNAYVPYAKIFQGKAGSSGDGGGEGGSEDEDVPTDIPYDAVGAVLGKATSEPHPGTTDWSGMNLEFTGSFDASAVSGLNVPSGVTFDSKKGAVFPAGSAVQMFYFVAGYQGKWTPMALGNFGLRFKLESGGSINLQGAQCWGDVGRVFVDITETGTTVYDGGESGNGQGVAEKLVDYKVGNEWTDILFTTNDAGGYDTYMKKASDDTYTKVASTTSYRSGGSMNSGGAQIFAKGANVTYMKIFQGKDSSSGDGGNTGGSTDTSDAYDGTQGKVTDVLGSDAVIIQNMQFSSDFDTNMAGVTSPAGTLYDDGKGMQLGAGKQFQYLPSTGYTPLTYKGMTFGVKAGSGDAAVVQVKHPSNNSFRTYVQIKTNSVWVCQSNADGGFAGCENLVDYVPGSGWNDYLIKANENNGYDVYAKPQAEEDWTLVCSTTSYRPGGSAAMGIQMYSSTGNSWYKYAAVYGTPDQLPEPEGPEAGTKMTIEDIIGGIAVAKEELVFDSNFNGIESNAQLKNMQTGEVAEEQPTVGSNGIELAQTAGKYFAWNSGTENSWKPLTKENPVMFRAKLDAGSMLDVQLNGYPRASIYLYPEKLIVQGTSQTQAPDFAPGTGWVNYLVTRDSSNFMVWTKLDGETEWTLRVTSNGFRTAGFYGVLLANTTANKATVSTVKQYKVERMVLTDPTTIATMTNRVYIDEDFSEDKGIHNIITGKIEDGVFMRDPEAEPHASYPNSSRLDIDLSQVNPKGEWFVRFKYNVKTKDSVMSCDMVNNGNKIAIDCHDDYVFIINRTTKYGKTNTEAAAGVDTWAELLFAWTDNSYCDVYWHKVGDDEWIKTHTKFVPGSEANDKLAFHCSLEGQVDDVKVYSGDYLKIDEPVLESGLLKTSGEYFTGTLESRYDRRATLITAVYDKTYGYTKFVKAKNYEVLSGRGANLTNTFVTTGVDETEDVAAVMLWDTLETGIPLGDMAGAALVNRATGAPDVDDEVGVKAEANYNDVRVTGYTGIRNGRVTISVVDENGALKAVGQTTSSGTGLIDASVAVDPASASGIYTVRVQYGTTEATAMEVELSCDDIPYNTITDVTSMKNFINNYGSETAKKWNREEDFASDVYERYLNEKGSTTTFNSLYDFRDVMDAATQGEVNEREFCLDVNTAASAGKWSEVQNLVLNGTLGITIGDLAGVSDKKELFLRMTGGYKSENDVLVSFQNALAAQKTAEAAGGGFGGGGAGGGGSVGSGIFQGTTGFDNTGGGAGGGGAFGGMEPVELPADFTDLEGVDWAKNAINSLRNMGIISGNGDGTFAPNREVTREEFLKMALSAAGIQGKGTAELTFTDVDANEWYYPYVAAAFEAGIITGQSETQFGIGQKITRADMAVMLKRIMDYKNITLKKKVAAYVFDDFNTIPEYARESVTALAQAELMNGKGQNKFEGGASATRAESAVAIFRTYNYMVEGR